MLNVLKFVLSDWSNDWLCERLGVFLLYGPASTDFYNLPSPSYSATRGTPDAAAAPTVPTTGRDS